MPDTQVVSGSELTSNPGNANLGYSTGIGYGANPANSNPFEGVDNTLARIQEQDYKDRTQRHLEQRADIEGTAQMLAQTKGSLFNTKDEHGNNVSFTPLPEDKKIMDAQADKIRKLTLNHPETYKTLPEFFEAQKELEYMRNHAGLRSAFAAQQNLLASTEADPTERAGLLGNADEQIKSSLTDYKMPVPYRQGPKFIDELADPKLWQDQKDLQQFGTVIEKRPDGTTFEVKKAGIPTNELLKPLTDVSNRGYVNAQNAMTLWLRKPQAQDPNYINAMNAKIAENAAARGIQPIYGAQVTPDGKVVYSQDPRQLLAAHNLYSYGALRNEEKPSDFKSKEAETQARIKKMKNDSALGWARLKFDKDKQAQEKEKYHATNAALEVADTFNNARNGKQETVDIKITPDLLAAAKTSGLDLSKYKFTKINAKDQNITEIVGAQKYNAAGVLQDDYEAPEEAYHLISPTGAQDDRVVARVPQFEKRKDSKDHETIVKTGYKWTFVSPQEGIANKIKYINSSSGSKSIQIVQAIDDAVNTLNEAFGAPKEAKQAQQEQTSDDEAVIRARLQPAKVKRKDGTTINVLYDPVTQKRYAAE